MGSSARVDTQITPTAGLCTLEGGSNDQTSVKSHRPIAERSIVATYATRSLTKQPHQAASQQEELGTVLLLLAMWPSSPSELLLEQYSWVLESYITKYSPTTEWRSGMEKTKPSRHVPCK